ncbi:MAG: caspase family protein, partial [SAR324 cluster bacterium]|nr:caspase family protein [SAR324 cluster bacterium]
MQGRETAGAERRVALVIGNSAYDRSMGRLVNPVNDAEDMATT